MGRQLDLSTRSNAKALQPWLKSLPPIFSKPEHWTQSGFNVGALTDIFSPNAGVTIHYVFVQVSTACTIQLLDSIGGISPTLQVQAKDSVRFAGRFLGAGAKLQLACTPNTVVSFDVVWSVGYNTQFLATQSSIFPAAAVASATPSQVDIEQVRGQAVLGTGAVGTLPVNLFDSTGANIASISAAGAVKVDGSAVTQPTNAPVKTTIETTTPLAGAATFRGAWHDRLSEGTNFVTAMSRADVIGVSSGFFIEASDDIGNANLTYTLHSFAGNGNSIPQPNVINPIFAQLFSRYWRVGYTNGAGAQTSFEIVTTSQASVPLTRPQRSNSPLFYNDPEIVPVYAMGNASFNTYQDNQVFSNVLAFPSQQQQGPGQVVVEGQKVYGGGFTGTTDTVRRGWSFMRTPTVFRYVTTAATGSTAVWTPALNNKFRLLRYRVIVGASAIMAAATDLTIKLLDSATDIAQNVIVRIPAAALGSGVNYDSNWIDLGAFGVLSAAANNALNVNLSAALTGGLIQVMVAGVEE